MDRRHKKSLTPVHNTWCMMKQRCLNKNSTEYPRYGARGIKVCERWMKFVNFYDDMGARPLASSIERIDNNGNYDPSNCRWATKKQQANNRRNNHFIEFNGEKLTIQQWSDKLKIGWGTIYKRIKLGWDIANILISKKSFRYVKPIN